MDAIGEAGKVTVSEKNGCFDILTRCTKNVSSIRRQMSERAQLGGQHRSDVQVFFWGDNTPEIEDTHADKRGDSLSVTRVRRVAVEVPHHFQPQLSASLPAAKHLFIACPCFLLCVLLFIFPVFFFLLSYVVPIPPPLPPPSSPTPRGSVLRITQFLH